MLKLLNSLYQFIGIFYHPSLHSYVTYHISFENFTQGFPNRSTFEYLLIALQCPNLSNNERNRIWRRIFDRWISHNHKFSISAIIFQRALKTLYDNTLRQRSNKIIKDSTKSPMLVLNEIFRLRVLNIST